MTTLSAPTSNRARMAAILLMALGVGTVMLVVANGTGGWGVLVLPIAVVQLVIGLFILRHSTWARWLGIVLSVFGILLGLVLLPSAFNPVSQQEAGSSWPALRLILAVSIVPYFLVVVGLVSGGRHFRRQG